MCLSSFCEEYSSKSYWSIEKHAWFFMGFFPGQGTAVLWCRSLFQKTSPEHWPWPLPVPLPCTTPAVGQLGWCFTIENQWTNGQSMEYWWILMIMRTQCWSPGSTLESSWTGAGCVFGSRWTESSGRAAWCAVATAEWGVESAEAQ